MCVETLAGVLFWSSDLPGKPFRAFCEFSFGADIPLTDLLAFCEFSFGADIIIAILAQARGA